ncbi:MAG: 4-oxalocrotonate tautomerase family protein [Candidatus Aceula lacicola]|nr:4-oxalocrotonate tautomerase family protein [Candidatus Aceula lacicola]
MPYINVKLVGKITKEQKQKIAAEFTETLEKVANKPKDHTYVVFDEVNGENWAVGDKLLG